MSLSSSQQPQNSKSRLRRRDFLKTGVALAAGLPAFTQTQAAETLEIQKIGDAPQLFVDLTRVEKLENVKQAFHTAQKHPGNPVLRKEKPWETQYGTWGTVLYDEEEKIWKAKAKGRDGVSGDRVVETWTAKFTDPSTTEWTYVQYDGFGLFKHIEITGTSRRQ